MRVQKSETKDIPQIMRIIKQAQAYFKEQGIDQWQNGYPNEEVIANDIEKGDSYIFIRDGKTVATTVVSFEQENCYENIYEGKWTTHGDYGVIHRIAVDNASKGSGTAQEVIEFAEQMCRNRGVLCMRVDTHEENIPMQRVLAKNGYQYCGVIYLDYGAKRVAYEKLLG